MRVLTCKAFFFQKFNGNLFEKEKPFKFRGLRSAKIIYLPCSSRSPPGGGGGGKLGRGLQDFRLHVHLPVGSAPVGSLRISGTSPWAHMGMGLGGHKDTQATLPLRPLHVQYPVQARSTNRSHGLYRESWCKHGKPDVNKDRKTIFMIKD